LTPPARRCAQVPIRQQGDEAFGVFLRRWWKRADDTEELRVLCVESGSEHMQRVHQSFDLSATFGTHELRAAAGAAARLSPAARAVRSPKVSQPIFGSPGSAVASRPMRQPPSSSKLAKGSRASKEDERSEEESEDEDEVDEEDDEAAAK